MDAMWLIFFALLGAAVGSFLNVCIDRLPVGRSVIRSPSHCDACQHRLVLIDLVPIFSYLWLGRRCRYCKVLISMRVFWVEVGSGILFAFLYWYFSAQTEIPVIEFAIVALYCSLFIVLGVIDLERKLILNKITYPAIIATLIILAINSFLPELGLFGDRFFIPEPSILSGIIGGGFGFLLFFMIAYFFRGGVGWGDVKMAGLIGLVTGFPLVFVSLFLGVVCGGLVAGILLILKIKKRKEPIPFGPFLSLGVIITLIWGNDIFSWYRAFY
jgi:leader peptidase (prepilin peptidase)/N-methyltransferase